MTSEPGDTRATTMKIGILQTGRSPEEMRERHGDYDDLFRRLLAGQGFEFQTWAVLDGELPASVRDADGWLVTGSRFGVYEPHAWIAPLEAFLRDAYASGVPIVGICFGHQILARALGGKAARFDGGWRAGVEHYDLDGCPDGVDVIAWHQDQVIEPPPAARVIGSSPGCRYAALAYDDRALSLQPHPEFSADFVADLIEARRGVIPPEVAERARASLPGKLSTERIATMIGEFFRRPRAHTERGR